MRWFQSIVKGIWSAALVCGWLLGCSGGSVGQDPCAGRDCGQAEGKDCGTCPGATEACDEAGQCVDACEGRQCGEVEPGIDCGTCPGATEVCDEAGQCVDACEGRECGEPVPGIHCGTCQPPRQCGIAGQCFAAGGCPADTAEVTGQGYCIDHHEVTNLRYQGFLVEHGNDCYVEEYDFYYDGIHRFKCHKENESSSSNMWLSGDQWVIRSGYEEHPVTDVTLGGARVACEHWGGHLCKLREWELACQGPTGFAYPYGDEYDPHACNACYPTPSYECDEHPVDPVAVGSYPGCEGGYPGLYDMSGNVFEWVDHCVHVDMSVVDNQKCVLKGGAYAGPLHDLDCLPDDPDDLHLKSPYDLSEIAGFRCCFYLD